MSKPENQPTLGEGNTKLTRTDICNSVFQQKSTRTDIENSVSHQNLTKNQRLQLGFSTEIQQEPTLATRFFIKI